MRIYPYCHGTRIKGVELDERRLHIHFTKILPAETSIKMSTVHESAQATVLRTFFTLSQLIVFNNHVISDAKKVDLEL